MAHEKFLEQLGSPADIAKRLSELSNTDLARDAVRKWRTQGIPWRWRSHLLTLAKEKGKAIPEDLLPGVPVQ